MHKHQAELIAHPSSTTPQHGQTNQPARQQSKAAQATTAAAAAVCGLKPPRTRLRQREGAPHGNVLLQAVTQEGVAAHLVTPHTHSREHDTQSRKCWPQVVQLCVLRALDCPLPRV